MPHRPCWNCAQPATNVMTREGSESLPACDNCTRIDREQAVRQGWTITPIPCTTCDENLYWLPNRRTACLNGHTGSIDDIPVPPGHDLTSRYHEGGHSHVMIRTVCRHCEPI